MSDRELKVNFGALESAAADIKGGAQKIRGRLDQLDRELRPLQSDWTGAAAQAYQVAKDEWTKAITDMQQLLNDLGQAVSTSNDDYNQAEKANQGRW